MNNVLAKKQPNEDELAIKARFDRSMVWTSGDSVRYLLVDVIAPTRKTVVANEALPLNLAMVIDRSGSMSGDRLGAAKRAAEGILEALTEKDTISLVSFCHESTVHLQQVRADAAGKRQAGDAIGSIESDGTTNIAEGWMDGARCVGERMDESSEGQH